MLFNIIIILMFFLPSIAFFTIMERKMLGIFHIRLGPNKVGIMGVFQPFSDALKLFTKNFLVISKINSIFWNSSSTLILSLFLILINFLPVKMENNSILLNMLMLMLILTMFIFPIFWGSFFSFSKYSIVSSKRLITQMISYEMGLMMIMIIIMPVILKMNLFLLMMNCKIFNLTGTFLMVLFFILILSESSRIPFDFIEGESELVSGFNTEFSGPYFSLFFIYEYGMMIFFSILITMMFSNFIMSFILMLLFIIIRASFPRMRYDQMMILMWKMLYPLIISTIMTFKLI